MPRPECFTPWGRVSGWISRSHLGSGSFVKADPSLDKQSDSATLEDVIPLWASSGHHYKSYFRHCPNVRSAKISGITAPSTASNFS